MSTQQRPTPSIFGLSTHRAMAIVGFALLLSIFHTVGCGLTEPIPFSNTPCINCHQADYDRAKNPDHKAEGFSTSCGNCHNKDAWKTTAENHDRFFPLEGVHATTDCNKCHQNNVFRGTPRTCVGCHQADYDGAPNHKSSNYPTACDSCHKPTGWKPATFANHPFPLQGDHNQPCNVCHTDSSNIKTFSCTAQCHAKGETDGDHGSVGGYVYESKQCYACHPQGN